MKQLKSITCELRNTSTVPGTKIFHKNSNSNFKKILQVKIQFFIVLAGRHLWPFSLGRACKVIDRLGRFFSGVTTSYDILNFI